MKRPHIRSATLFERGEAILLLDAAQSFAIQYRVRILF
jgi:hypothetical protein